LSFIFTRVSYLKDKLTQEEACISKKKSARDNFENILSETAQLLNISGTTWETVATISDLQFLLLWGDSTGKE